MSWGCNWMFVLDPSLKCWMSLFHISLVHEQHQYFTFHFSFLSINQSQNEGAITDKCPSLCFFFTSYPSFIRRVFVFVFVFLTHSFLKTSISQLKNVIFRYWKEELTIIFPICMKCCSPFFLFNKFQLWGKSVSVLGKKRMRVIICVFV